jgi:hypothetical protein
VIGGRSSFVVRRSSATEPVFRVLLRVVDACRAAAGISDGERDAAAIAA